MLINIYKIKNARLSDTIFLADGAKKSFIKIKLYMKRGSTGDR